MCTMQVGCAQCSRVPLKWCTMYMYVPNPNKHTKRLSNIIIIVDNKSRCIFFTVKNTKKMKKEY